MKTLSQKQQRWFERYQIARARDGSKEIDDNRYSTQAQALHYGRG